MGKYVNIVGSYRSAVCAKNSYPKAITVKNWVSPGKMSTISQQAKNRIHYSDQLNSAVFHRLWKWENVSKSGAVQGCVFVFRKSLW